MSERRGLFEKMCDHCLVRMDRSIKMYIMTEEQVSESTFWGTIRPCTKKDKDNNSCIYLFSEFLGEFAKQTEGGDE
jgi:hypothetical protein